MLCHFFLSLFDSLYSSGVTVCASGLKVSRYRRKKKVGGRIFFSVSTRTEFSSSHLVGEDCLKIAAYKKLPSENRCDIPATGRASAIGSLCNGVEGISLGEEQFLKPGQFLIKFYML